MTRTAAREIAIQICFSISQNEDSVADTLEVFFDKTYYSTLAEEDELFAEYPSRKQRDYISEVVLGTEAHRTELDSYITKYSVGWKLARISRIAGAIMRTALFEVLYMEDIPASVAINEAVELAKGYEEAETVSFINGILGSFMRGELGRELDETAIDEMVSDEAETAADETANDEAETAAETPTEDNQDVE